MELPKADLEAKNSSGSTPLHLAALGQKPENARVLLEHGAALEAKNRYGRTPLHIAASRQDAETALLLLQRGADPEVMDILGKRPCDILGGRPALSCGSCRMGGRSGYVVALLNRCETLSH